MKKGNPYLLQDGMPQKDGGTEILSFTGWLANKKYIGENLKKQLGN